MVIRCADSAGIKENGMSREVWLDLFDELRDLALSRGMTEEAAELYAQENINARYAETIRDEVDLASDRRKYDM